MTDKQKFPFISNSLSQPQRKFWGLSVSDMSCHEIKRRLLLGRKVMTNLDSILKSRDITLPTKVCLVKAMVFPVVMYGCESWTIKVFSNCIKKQVKLILMIHFV